MRRVWADGAGDVHAFFCRTEALDAADLEAAVALLSHAERERHARFGFARDRREYAVAHALVRVVVGAVLGVPPSGVELTADDRGKPMVVLSNSQKRRPAFSLSHCQGLATCVVAPEALVGIDVEAMHASVDFSRIAAEYFTPAECEGLEACHGDARVRRFYALWTLKEALFKATGLAPGELGGASFTISDSGAVSLGPCAALPADEWTCRLARLSPFHTLSIVASASSGASPQLWLHEFSGDELVEAASLCRPIDSQRGSPGIAPA